jgi:hypothetical protein
MKLPHMFCQIHGSTIFNLWMENCRPPIVRVIPQEPLGRVEMNPSPVPDFSVTVVSVRCWNDRGTMQFEAASPADLKVAQEWAERHRETAPEDFRWVPSLA